MLIESTHISGSGNLFSIIDNRTYQFSSHELELLAIILNTVNDYNDYIGEGLLIIDSCEDELDFIADFYNPDGSHGAMCGNGGRSVIYYARQTGLVPLNKKSVRFKMVDNYYKGEFYNDKVRLYLPPPVEIKPDVTITINNKRISGGYVNVGTDHFVIDYYSIAKMINQSYEEIDMKSFAPTIRYHSAFEPRGVNVNVYRVNNDGTLRIRTYERGVEGETGACGTGAISTAIIAVLSGNAKFPVTLIPPSRQTLNVSYSGIFPNKIQELSLEGEVTILDMKTYEIPDNILFP